MKLIEKWYNLDTNETTETTITEGNLYEIYLSKMFSHLANSCRIVDLVNYDSVGLRIISLQHDATNQRIELYLFTEGNNTP